MLFGIAVVRYLVYLVRAILKTVLEGRPFAAVNVRRIRIIVGNRRSRLSTIELVHSPYQSTDLPRHRTGALIVVGHHYHDVATIDKDVEIAVQSGETAAVTDHLARRAFSDTKAVPICIPGMICPHQLEAFA